VRLSGGSWAFALYQFDRREVLRYTEHDRLAAYRRIFNYGGIPVPAGSRPNTDFHKLFAHFIHQVTLFWRDKRISDVVRERAYDPSFGSIAIVHRAGLDLRCLSATSTSCASRSCSSSKKRSGSLIRLT
jgi:hypothetical protein